MTSREGEERGQSSLPAPPGETAENNNGNLQQQRLETPPITMPQGTSTPVNASNSQPQYPGGDQVALFNMLRAQVEYYFSPQNLGRDSYLRNMLTDAPTKAHHQPPPPQNMALMTPIEVIANFPKVWNICASFGVPEPPAVLLGKALQGSTMITMSADGAWIGPTLQQLPPFTGGSGGGGGGGVSTSAPPSPSPSLGPPSSIAAGGAPQFPQQSPYNMAPYPPPQMMMLPMQQPDGTILHQSFPPPYYMGGGPPPPPNNQNSNNNRPLSRAGSTSPSSASQEDAWSIPSQTKASPKISMVSATSVASLSSLSEQQHQQQSLVQQPPPYGGPMMGQQQQQPPYPMHSQQFLSPPYGVPLQPYPPYYNPQHPQQQHMHPANVMPPPGVRYGGTPPPPPPRGYPPPYPYPGMMPPPPPPPPQYIGDGYPPPHPHGYPPRHQPNVGDNHHRKGGGGGGSFDGPKKHHDGGGSGSKKKKKNKNNFDKKRGNDSNYGYRSPNNFGQQQQQQQQHNYGGGGNASSSPHFNNKYPKQHARKGGDTTTNNEQQKNKNGGGKEEKAVLNPFDFPGLDGKAATESSAKAATAKDETLVGYASALLKKKENDSSTTKMTAAASAVALPEDEDDNNMMQQTEAMEKEILSEFHDLSIHESPGSIGMKQYDTPVLVDKTDGCNTVETSPSSTDNGVVSPQSPTDENSQSIPLEMVNKASATEQNPRVDVEGSVELAPLPPPPAAVVEHETLGDDNPVNDNKEQNTEVEKPAAPAAWGSKRLFADVVASQK